MFFHSSIFRRAATLFTAGALFIGFGAFTNTAEAATSVSPHPTEIDIPAIKASIPVISLGLTPSGNLDVPHNFVQAGWYENGPMPGQSGSAVIDGHVDNGGYKPTVAGVFKHLNSVVVGDIITVKISDGTSAQFKVTGTAVYAYNKFPSNLVFNQTGGAYLKIITCHGTWLPSAKTYNQRLVVTAERI